jgi:catecholate siderophore receptor
MPKSTHKFSPLYAAIWAAMSLPVVAWATDSTPNAAAPAAVSPAAGLAADAVAASNAADAADKKATELDKVDVHGTPIAQPSSPKLTASWLDTPQTITVVPQKIIAEQNLLTLRDILTTLPGITFGAGEGGGGYGDSINLRGFTGANDITIDGVRDSAQYTRTDPFDLDSVELVNGANSVYAGSGSVGGSINLVSKTPVLGDHTTVTGGVGTADYGRFTVDTNQQIGDTTAFRVNLMAHENDVPGRDVEDFKRFGLAPSITFGLGTDTSWTLAYFHQQDDNVPQYGVPTYKGQILPGVDPHAYYGYANYDTQQIHADDFTSTIQHRFNDDLSVRNLTRAGRVTQFSLVDPPQGTFCEPDDLQPNGASCTLNAGTALQIVVPAGYYMPSGPRGNIRDTTNKIFYNQTDLSSTFKTGAIEHTAVVGASFSHESYDFNGYSEYRNADGTNPYAAPGYFPFTPIGDPDDIYTGPAYRTLTGKNSGTLDDAAVYAFDNAKFDEHWSLNYGLRYERADASSTTYTVKTYTAPTVAVPNPVNTGIGTITGAAAPAEFANNLLSWRVGLVYKPVENASVYAAYSNSKTPSAVSVNGSCTVATAATIAAGTANCDSDPQTALNYEIGAKWDVLDNRLSLSGSIFRNDRTNYQVADPGDPDNPSGQMTLDGKARVDGLLLSAIGNLTDDWAVYANYAHLKSKVLQGASNYVAGQGGDYTKGDPLLSTPENSVSLWTTYDVSNAWQVGYGATYVGSYIVSQHSATNPSGPLNEVDAYWLQRAMVAYKFNPNFSVQLNINNLFNEKYLTRVRTAGDIAWGTPGDARSAQVTATYKF